MSSNYEDRQRGGGYDSDDDGDRRPMGGRGGMEFAEAAGE